MTRQSPRRKRLSSRRFQSCLNLSVTRSVNNVLGVSSSNSSRDVLAAKAGQDAGVGAGKSARGSICVHLASMTEVGHALCVGGSAGGSVHLATKTRLHGRDNVLKDIAFRDDLGACITLEGVLAVGVEVVADGVEERVAGDLGGTSRGVVDVVALERYKVIGAGEIHTPVMVAVTRRRPRGGSVDLAVGNGDAVGGAVTEDDVLTSNQVSGDMVNPDKVG